ncbi:MAG: hypothetical protein K0S41_1449 [Anaerocolumna sp.]|jgi:hypothetical protein|nr:hypothetical protein [Anaerocolumna sp.]
MMPAKPNSMFIAKQMKKYIEKKLIIDFTFHDLEGNYNFLIYRMIRPFILSVEKY